MKNDIFEAPSASPVKQFQPVKSQASNEEGQAPRGEQEKFLSPFIDFSDKPWKFAKFGNGEHSIRLLAPSSGDPARYLTQVAVKHRSPSGNLLEGNISAGSWFFAIQKYLKENFADRMNTNANPDGDLVFRTKKRVYFFCAYITALEAKLQLVNLSGTPYPSSTNIGDGEVFMTDLAEDFNPVDGRIIGVKVIVDPKDARKKDYRIMPKKPVLASEFSEILPQGGLPDLFSLVRQSSPQEVMDALSTTKSERNSKTGKYDGNNIPQDIYEALSKA